ncbi:MAG: glycine--tRNA ligase [Patescibacteria group bacterium]
MGSSGTFEKVVSLLKRRGFVYPSSDIYGGLSGFWDFGPLGVELKNNVKAAWWGSIVRSREDVVGLDSAIIYNRRVWEASGHTQNFADPLVECRKCHARFRADTLKREKCPNCGAGDFTAPKMFNLMFKTYVGPVESEEGLAYLRPETAQGIFINFQNVLNTTRLKVPFGIAQIGKAFRNEITTGNLIFRSREFEQAELEWFCEPKEASKWFKYWQKERISWFTDLGMQKKNLKFREHEVKERAHYAVTAFDIEYQFPWGWGELEGIANRSDYDLKAHNLSYKEEETGREYVPFVVEPSVGIERSAFAFLLDSYSEEGAGDKKRVILKLHPKLAPYKVAVFPLLANKPELVKKAREIYQNLTGGGLAVSWDARGNIGKRYFSQDEIGTPWCVTVDFQSLEDSAVTVRERDSAKQKRVKITDLSSYFLKELS